MAYTVSEHPTPRKRKEPEEKGCYKSCFYHMLGVIFFNLVISIHKVVYRTSFSVDYINNFPEGMDNIVPYSGKLSREKTFVNFMVLWLLVKVFSVKFKLGAW